MPCCARDPQDRRALALGRTLHAERKSAATQIDRTTPKLKAAYRKPVSLLAFRDASLTQVFESLKLASGINFMFDRDVKADTRLTISVSNKPLEDVIRVILAGQRLATRVLDEDTLLVYPNTRRRCADYQELVIRTFYLGNADATKIVNLARNVIKVRDVYVDEKLNLLVMRDTAEVVRLAERVIANLGRSRAGGDWRWRCWRFPTTGCANSASASPTRSAARSSGRVERVS